MALKFIAKLGKGAAELRALEREIAIMSKLRHKNIISLHECIETDSEVFGPMSICSTYMQWVLVCAGVV